MFTKQTIYHYAYRYIHIYSYLPLTENASTMVNFIKIVKHYMSRAVRKPAFCICENKDADQLRGNRKADQRLCFRYIDATIPLLPKYEITSL